MLEKRYMYYVMFSMIMTVTNVFTAHLLISFSYKGAIAGMLAATIVGFLLCYSLLKSLEKFPGKNAEEIMRASRIPPFARVLFLTLFSIVWIAMGWFLQGQSVIAYQFYFLPNANQGMIWVAHAIIVAILSRMDSKSILFLCEAFFLIWTGMEIVVLWMFGTYKYFSWTDILLALTYAPTKPAFAAITLSSMVFAGLSTMAAFNKVISHEGKKLKAALYIAIFGLFMLLTRQLLVIGATGMDGAMNFSMPGFSAVDSIRFELFITERSIYFFLVTITTMMVIGNVLLWHSAIMMFRSVFRVSAKTEWAIIALIVFAPVVLQRWLLVPAFQAAIQTFAWVYLASEVLFVVLLMICMKRKASEAYET